MPSTNPVVILTDSASDLGKELRDRYQIDFVPFIVTLGDKEYFDDGTLSQQDIFDFVAETKILPKTAARNADIFKDFFGKYIDAGNDIVYIGISKELSLNTVNARAAAQEMGLEDRIFVIDSLVLSSGIGLQVIKAAEWRDEGLSASQIAERASTLGITDQTSFVIDTVEYLHKGGRCSGLASFFASLLSLHPTIRMKEGKMYAAKKFMGAYNKIIDKYILDTLALCPEYDDSRVFITHCAATPESIETARNILKERTTFKEILVTEAGSTVTSHCGRGTLGILYLTKKNIW